MLKFSQHAKKKTLISNFNAVESNNALTVNQKKTISNIFKDFLPNLADSLLNSLMLLINITYNLFFNIIQNISLKNLST